MSQIQGKQWLLSRYEGAVIPGCLSFAAGMAMAFVLPAAPFVNLPVVLSLCCMLLGLLCWSERRWVLRGAVFTACFLLGALYFYERSFHPGPTDISQWSGSEAVDVRGMLISHQREKHQAQLQVKALNQHAANGVLLVYTGKLLLPPLGAEVSFKGDLSAPQESLIPGGFNQKQYLLSQKITATLRHVVSLQVLSENPTTWQGHFLRWVEGLREKISTLLKETLPSPESEVLGGIVLGDRAIPVDSATRQQFIHTGLIHVLAASGLNVGIVAGFIMLLGLRLKIPRRFRLLLAMGAVAVYALLTGLPPSIQRAGAMLELALLLKLLDKTLSPLALLSVAVFLLLCVNPDAIGSLGFQFSVLTTFGLITMVPALQEWLGFYLTKWLSGLILVPLVAQLWVLPLSIYHFNQFPLHSIPLNIAALAMVAPLTAIGFTAGFLSLLWRPLGEWASLMAWPFLKGLLWIVHWGDGMTWAQWTVPSPSSVIVLFQYISLLGAALVFYRMKQSPVRQKALALSVCLLLAILPCVLQRYEASNQATLTMLPLPYQQTAYVIQPQGSSQALVALPSDSGYWQGRAVMDYCRHRNLKPLTAVLILPGTWGQGPKLGVGVQKLLQSPYVQANQTQVFSLGRYDSSGMPLRPLFPSQALRIGNVELLATPKAFQVFFNGVNLLPGTSKPLQTILKELQTHQYTRLTLTGPVLSLQVKD